MPSRPSTAPRPRFIHLLAVASRRVQAAVAQEGEGHSATRAGLLLSLRPEEPTPMATVGPMLDLTAPALSNLVERAVRDGLIVREPDTEDGRAWNLALTPEGRSTRKRAVERARSLNERLCEGFTEGELAIVARWLDAVRRRFPSNKETTTR